MQIIQKYRYLILFILSGFVYTVGLFNVSLMDVDATQYASICLETLKKNDFLHITNHYRDYLDKPPLLFWLGTIFFKIFGTHDWAFRLPSLLSSILGIYSTYRLASFFYNKQIGLNAALMLTTCQAYFLMNHDVRTDTILTNLIIFSTWQILQFLETKKIRFLILGFFVIGLAMLEKGPIGIVVPALAIGTFLIVKRDFKSVFKWQWILGLLITALVLVPMCIGLYEQFDMHPEKIVNAKKGVSGIRFFFWEQSFGRITGENVWKDNSGYFFFTHTFLWSFFPWAFLTCFALWFKLSSLFANKFNDAKNEYLTTGGFVLTFIALSFSSYKLPHYIFVVFPFAAIFTAAWLAEISEKKQKLLLFATRLQNVLCFLIIAVAIVINNWFFPVYKFPVVLITSFLLLTITFLYYKIKQSNDFSPIFFSAATAISINFLLNANFYPQLLKYQSGSEVAFYMTGKNIPEEKCFAFHENSFALDVYLSTIWKDGWEEMIPDSLKKYADIWVYTTQEGRDRILKEHPTYFIEEKKFEDFHVTGLTLKFLIPGSRKKEITNRYLIHLKEK